jgi:hypothetical protein
MVFILSIGNILAGCSLASLSKKVDPDTPTVIYGPIPEKKADTGKKWIPTGKP